MWAVVIHGVIIFKSSAIRACYRYLRSRYRKGKAAHVIRLGI